MPLETGSKLELHRRSIVKALTWRLAGTLGTCLIGWWFTGSLRIALGISLIDSAVKIFGFYVHERAWHRIAWGFVQPGLADGKGGGI
ncbi:MAG: hypothetical protein A2498_06475 [Lentisphaerae bacterium RIFOXYC12_FULL_60_16]|nr:MAG: hypothetical protein A2498_06475 [Lentisphaerae bacterium RIFOXYC12_FULL_60_16]OGV84932.1 MAG: hypothetical protein A2340_04565 [Lentisphaerae bacterium RIFOXYB12_FULL_60_10]